MTDSKKSNIILVGLSFAVFVIILISVIMKIASPPQHANRLLPDSNLEPIVDRRSSNSETERLIDGWKELQNDQRRSDTEESTSVETENATDESKNNNNTGHLESDEQARLDSAIKRYELLASLDSVKRKKLKAEPWKENSQKQDRETGWHLDIARIVKEQTPESLAVLLEDASRDLQKSVVGEFKDVLDDEKRMYWLDGLQDNSKSTTLHDAIRFEKSVYPTATEIERIRLLEYQKLQAADVSDDEFADGISSYKDDVIHSVAKRKDAVSLLPLIITDLETLLEIHADNQGRVDFIALMLGCCDGLFDYLTQRTFLVARKRSFQGSTYWCWLSGLDALVLNAAGVDSRNSKKLLDVEWLVSASDLRANNIVFPMASFQDAWDFIMPVFAACDRNAPDFLLTPELFKWLESLCPSSAKWQDGERCDVMRIVSRGRAGSPALALAIANHLKMRYWGDDDDKKNDYVLRFVVTLIETPTQEGWTPIVYDMFGDGRMMASLWNKSQSGNNLFRELRFMDRARIAKPILKEKTKAAIKNTSDEEWKSLLEWLLEGWK